METAALLDRYAAMLAELGHDPSPPWGGNSDHANKQRSTVTPAVVDRFADYAIGGIGFEIGHDHPMHLSDPTATTFAPSVSDAAFDETYRKNLILLLQLQLKKLVSFEFKTMEQVVDLLKIDGVVGGRHTIVEIAGRQAGISFHTAKVAGRAYAMRKAHGRWPDSLLEIGGGHGRFVRDVAKCSAETRLFYSDLPLNMLLAARYLTRVFPGEVALVWSGDDALDPAARINIVAPWRLDSLPSGIEVFANFLSCQHMRAENHEYYTDILVAKDVRSIFHVNRDRAATSEEINLDVYPWLRHFAVQSSHQISKANVQGRIGGGKLGTAVSHGVMQQYLVRKSGG